MKNVSKICENVCKDLRKSGFGGIRFEEARVYVGELSDWTSDGKTKEDYEEFCRDYCCVTLTVYTDWIDDLNDYVDFNYEDFERDIKNKFLKELGADVIAPHFNINGREFEVTRKD